MLLEVLEGRFGAEDVAAQSGITLAELAQELLKLKDRDPDSLAGALLTVLKSASINSRDDDDAAATDDLCTQVTQLFLVPTVTVPPTAAEKALGAISALDAKYSLTPRNLLRVVAYTNTQDTWTTEAAAESATAIMNAKLTPESLKLSAFIRSDILEGYLRPLFSRSRSERITAAGRKAHYHEPSRGVADTDEAELKPWKHKDVHAVAIFAWAVSHADEQLIRDSWPLFLPVLLALLDEGDTKYRLRGLEIAQVFLSKCSGTRLRDTGVGELLAQSILPTFNFLPSLTPAEESALLLDAAYPAILQLARSQFDRPEDDAGKRSLLAKVLREGVFTGYWHANQHVRVVEVLSRRSADVVEELGFAAIPHLKDLIPMYSEILLDPFMTRYPAYLLSAVRGLKVTMRNCWPRISTPAHQGEILKAITLGWLSLQDDESSRDESQKAADDGLRTELTEAAAILAAICTAAGVDLSEQTSQLVAKDKTLEGLFGTPAHA